METEPQHPSDQPLGAADQMEQSRRWEPGLHLDAWTGLNPAILGVKLRVLSDRGCRVTADRGHFENQSPILSAEAKTDPVLGTRTDTEPVVRALETTSGGRRNRVSGIPLVVQWLRHCSPNTGGQGLIPGQGTGSLTLQPRVYMTQLKKLACLNKDVA